MEEKNNRKKGKGRTTEKKKNTAIIQFSLRISELIGKLNWGGIRRALRRELRMAIILSNAKAMESKSRRPHSFPLWSPPTFRIIFFQFSPDPQANIIISDLAKLVDSLHLLICTSGVNSVVFHQRHLVGKFKWKGRIIKRGKSRTAEKTPLQYRGMRWPSNRLLRVAIILSNAKAMDRLALAVSRSFVGAIRILFFQFSPTPLPNHYHIWFQKN